MIHQLIVLLFLPQYISPSFSSQGSSVDQTLMPPVRSIEPTTTPPTPPIQTVLTKHPSLSTASSRDIQSTKRGLASIQCLDDEALILDVVSTASHQLDSHTLSCTSTQTPPTLKGTHTIKVFPWTHKVCEISKFRTMDFELHRVKEGSSHSDIDSCSSTDHMVKMDLNKYLNHLHRTTLPVSMRVETLDIPLDLLPPGEFVVCLRVSYTLVHIVEKTLCGKFINVGGGYAAAFRMSPRSTSHRYFTWPASERLSLESDAYDLFETEASGFRGVSSLKYRWTSVQTGSCAKLPIDVSQHDKPQLYIPADTVAGGRTVYCVTCTVSVKGESAETQFSIQFSPPASHYVEIQCLLNCHTVPNPSIPMLLKVNCPHACPSYDPAGITVIWTVSFPGGNTAITTTDFLYKSIDLRVIGAKDLKVEVELIYSTASRRNTGRGRRTFYIPENVTVENVPYQLIGKGAFDKCLDGVRKSEMQCPSLNDTCFKNKQLCNGPGNFACGNTFPNDESFCDDFGRKEPINSNLPTALSFWHHTREVPSGKRTDVRRQPGVDTFLDSSHSPWYNHVNRVTVRSTQPGEEYVVSRSIMVPSRLAIASEVKGRHLRVTKSTATGQVFSQSTSVSRVDFNYFIKGDTDLLEMFENCSILTYHDLSCLPVVAENFKKWSDDTRKEELIFRVWQSLVEPGRVHFGNVDAVLYSIKRLISDKDNCIYFTVNPNDSETIDVPLLNLIGDVNSLLKDVKNEPFEEIKQIFKKIIDILDYLSQCIHSNDDIQTKQVQISHIFKLKREVLANMCEKYPHQNDTNTLSATSSKSSVVWLNPFITVDDVNLLSVRLTGKSIKQEISYLFYDPFFTIVAHTVDFPTLENKEFTSRPVMIQLAEKSVTEDVGRKQRQNMLVTGLYNINFSHQIFPNVSTPPPQHHTVDRAGTASDCIVLEVLPSELYSTLLRISTSKITSVHVHSHLDTHLANLIERYGTSQWGGAPENTHFLQQLTKAKAHDNPHSRYHVVVEVDDTSLQYSSIEVQCQRLKCAYWDAMVYRWRQGYCLAESNRHSTDDVTCVCDLGSIFSAGTSRCEVTGLDIYSLQVRCVGRIFEHVWPTFIVLGILLVTIYLLYWASYNDYRTTHVRQAHALAYTNYQTDQYLVCLDSRLTTTSAPAITLVGNLRVSRMVDLFSTKDLFQQGRETWLLLTSRYPLGRLRNVLLTVDLRGITPQWSCSRVFVRHINSGESFFCDLQNTLPDENNMQLTFTIDRVESEPHQGWKSLFMRTLRRYHIVMSIVQGESSTGHTRVKHCLVASLSLLSTMLIALCFMYSQLGEIPKQRLIEEYGRGSDTHPIHLIVRTVLFISLVSAPLCTCLAWFVSRSRPRKNIIFEPFPKIVGPNRRIVWYPKMSLPEEDPPPKNSDSRQSLNEYSDKNTLGIPDLSSSRSTPRLSPISSARSSPFFTPRGSYTPPTSDKTESQFENPDEQKWFVQKLLDLSTSPSDTNTVTDSKTDVFASPVHSDKSVVSLYDDISINLSQNACYKGRKAKIFTAMRNLKEADTESESSSIYDFAREKEVPAQPYAKPEDTATQMEQDSRELSHRCTSFSLNSQVLCPLLVFFILLEAMSIVLIASMYTEQESKLYCIICLFSVIATFLILQPALCLMITAWTMKTKKSLRADKNKTANEFTLARNKEMNDALLFLQSDWLTCKKHLGFGNVHWLKQFSSFRILTRSNRKRKSGAPKDVSHSAKDYIGIALSILSLVIVVILLNLQAWGNWHRENQTNFNVDILDIESSGDTPLRVEEFWDHITSVYTKLRMTQGKLDSSYDIRVLSTIRLRQIRRLSQDDSPCKERFERHFHRFCRRWHGFDYDDRNYVGSWKHLLPSDSTIRYLSPFTYTQPYFWDNAPAVGDRVSTYQYDYPSGGYDYLLPLDTDDTELFQLLKALSWLDDVTSLVRLDLTTYLPDTQLATNILVTYEFSPVAVFQEASVYTYHMNNSLRTEFIIYAMVVFTIVILVMIKMMATSMYENGFKNTMKKKETLVRLLEILLGIAWITVQVMAYVWRKERFDDIRDMYLEKKQLITYIEFRSLGQWDRDMIVALGVVLVMVLAVDFMLVSSHIPLAKSLVHIAVNTRHVILLPLVAFATFEIPGKLLFQTISRDWADAAYVLNAVRLMMWPASSVRTIHVETDLKAAIFFCVAKSVADLIVINFFITVLSDLIECQKIKRAEEREIKAMREERKGENSKRSLLSRLRGILMPSSEYKVDSYHGPRSYTRPGRSLRKRPLYPLDVYVT